MASLLGAVAVLAVLPVGLGMQAGSLRPYTSVLTVPNGERFGTWQWPSMCPELYYAVGFSIRVEAKQGDGDDTAMNGVRLICGREGDTSYSYFAESHPGFWGDWSHPQYCPSGVLNAFQLRVEVHVGNIDDTTANNIMFRCSSGPTLEGNGLDWGEYGAWSQTCGDGGICGIETKIEQKQNRGDDTSLNDVRFRCCSRP